MEQFTLGFLPPASPAEAAHRLQQAQGSDEALIVYARSCLLTYNSAVRRGDLDAASTQETALRTVAISLNGGHWHGLATEDGGGTRLARALAAAAGEVPLWGQPGTFTVRLLAGCLVRVVYDGVVGLFAHHFAAHVVDLDQPFLSETGYRSFSEMAQQWSPLLLEGG